MADTAIRVLTLRPPADAIPRADRLAEDLRSYEYKEQIVAARGLQDVGVAAAGYADLLAGRLEDPKFQMRRACAECLRIIAEISKEMAIDAAIAEADAIKAAERAAALAAAAVDGDSRKSSKKSAQFQGSAASGQGSRSGSKWSVVRDAVSGSRIGSKASVGAGGGSAAPSRTGSKKGSKLGSEAGSAAASRKGSKVGYKSDAGGSAPPSRQGSKEHRPSSKEQAPSLAESGQIGEEGDRPKSRGSDESEFDERHVDVEAELERREKLKAKKERAAARAAAGEDSDLSVTEEEEESEDDGLTPRSKARKNPRAAIVPHVRALVHCLRDHKWQVRYSAARALAAIGGEDVVAVMDQVAPSLNDEHAETRAAVAEVFTALGPKATDWAKPLIERLKDDDKDVRVEVVKAIATMGRRIDTSLGHVRKLTIALKTDNCAGVRVEAAKALGSQDKSTIQYVKILEEAVVTDTDRWVRHAAIDVIVNLGAEAAPSVHGCLSCESDSEVRRISARALGRFTAELSEKQGTVRKSMIAARVKERYRLQTEYFEEKLRNKRRIQREEQIAEGREPNSDEDLPPESEEMFIEEEFYEQEIEVFDDTLHHYVEALAAMITDPDEEMRSAIIEALGYLAHIQEPAKGKQMLIWKDEKWQATEVPQAPMAREEPAEGEAEGAE